MHKKRDCEQCHGRGLIQLDPPQPAGYSGYSGYGAPPSQMGPEPVSCMLCDGKGNFDAWGKPCDAGNMHRK